MKSQEKVLTRQIEEAVKKVKDIEEVKVDYDQHKVFINQLKLAIKSEAAEKVEFFRAWQREAALPARVRVQKTI